MEEAEHSAIEFTGREAAVLSAVEVGLGSFLHGFHVPLAGHFLSLNQGFLLSRAVLKAKSLGIHSRALPFHISQIAAILKSLAPAGKKLTPMLGISVQGLLFTIGMFPFGANFAGITSGTLCLSLWAFLQPLLLYYLFFGRTLLVVGEHYYRELQQLISFTDAQFVWLLVALVMVKEVAAVLTAVVAFRLRPEQERRYQSRMAVAPLPTPSTIHASWRAHARGAFRDLFRPLFLVWILLTAIFFVFADSSVSTLVWALLRPIAVGFLLFFLVRAVPAERWLQRWETGRAGGFARAFQIAVLRLKEI